jgi:SAM-dependent methyltransferase
MRYLLATRPIGEFDDYRTSHITAGEKYHKRFVTQPGRAMMWELEKQVLRALVDARSPQRILDFACGTGRISSFLEQSFADLEIHGIDISESMLSIARATAVRANYSRIDSQAARARFGDGSFDMILAFRFFANAQPALRQTIAADLVALLAEKGVLVVNNHRNFWSPSYLARRLRGEKPLGALNGDIVRLFHGLGLRVAQTVSLGVWPQGDRRAMLLPWRAVRALERANLGKLAGRHTLGYNTIWVFSR